jgi:hypothetical protein
VQIVLDEDVGHDIAVIVQERRCNIYVVDKWIGIGDGAVACVDVLRLPPNASS